MAVDGNSGEGCYWALPAERFATSMFWRTEGCRSSIQWLAGEKCGAARCNRADPNGKFWCASSAIERQTNGPVKFVSNGQMSQRLSGHMSPAAKRQVDEKTPDSRLQASRLATPWKRRVISSTDADFTARRTKRSSPQGGAARAELGPWQPDEMSVRSRMC